MATAGAPSTAPKNMSWIPGGTFWMGSEEFYPEERPVHQVRVDGFFMDEHPVTVAEFGRFAVTGTLHHVRIHLPFGRGCASRRPPPGRARHPLTGCTPGAQLS